MGLLFRRRGGLLFISGPVMQVLREFAERSSDYDRRAIFQAYPWSDPEKGPVRLLLPPSASFCLQGAITTGILAARDLLAS
jgi:hypothetical protein